MPSIFSKIASLLKNYYNGKHTEELHPDLPPGIIKYGEKYVTSEPIRLNGGNTTRFISGRFDIVVEFDDKTYGVIDFKTGNPEGESFLLYSRQLHGYAYALEHPASGALSLKPISKLGLLYFHPSKISQSKTEWLSYDAEVHWIQINKDEQDFLNFIAEGVDLLEAAEPPQPSPNCPWCNYIRKLRGIPKII